MYRPVANEILSCKCPHRLTRARRDGGRLTLVHSRGEACSRRRRSGASGVAPTETAVLPAGQAPFVPVCRSRSQRALLGGHGRVTSRPDLAGRPSAWAADTPAGRTTTPSVVWDRQGHPSHAERALGRVRRPLVRRLVSGARVVRNDLTPWWQSAYHHARREYRCVLPSWAR